MVSRVMNESGFRRNCRYGFLEIKEKYFPTLRVRVRNSEAYFPEHPVGASANIIAAYF